MVTISVVIPVHNGGGALRDCLASLDAHREQLTELIVVDDGSTDGALKYAEEFGARVLSAGSRRGPANGRNVAALAAIGDVILFLDADVCSAPDTIPRVRQRFEQDPDLGAVFGSYDSNPAAPGLVSQFRNLLHCFVHHTGNPAASTFWAGCGAIRREIFVESGGFDISYSVPCVEDIELGIRLVRNGVKVVLDPSIQVRHLKRWTLRGMVTTDICSRGIPWTRLILASRRMPDDLNLNLRSRVSVALLGLSVLLGVLAVTSLVKRLPTLAWMNSLLCLGLFAAVIGSNLSFYRFLAQRRNLCFAVLSVPLHLTYFFCCGTAFCCGIAIHYGSCVLLKLGRFSQPPVRTPGD